MTTQTQEKIIDDIQSGIVKEASTRFELASGGSEDVVVKSPESIDDSVSVLAFTISNESSVSLDLYEDSTINSNGTSMYVSNSKTSSPSTTEQVFEYGGDYTAGTKKGEDLFAAGTKNNSTGTKTTNIRKVVSSGDTLRYEFTNLDDTQARLMGLKIIFAERDA